MTILSNGVHGCPRRSENPALYAGEPGNDHWSDEAIPVCSYCGSINPDLFMRMMEEGKELSPTDKVYKAYVSIGKFYFQHLSTAQMKRFVELYNLKIMKVGFPGHFYVMPFFMVAKPSDTVLP